MVSPARTPEQLAAERLVGIDILRGLAVLAVVMNHTPHYAMGGFRENPWFFPALLMDYGYLGVSLFVLISGFCIHRRAAIKATTTGQYSLNWIDFWKKRFWRLYPPYFVAMLLSIVCSCMLLDNRSDLLKSIAPDTAAHLLLVHNLTERYAGGLGNAAFWSLGMEEQLYLFYFLLFLMISRKSQLFGTLVAAITTVIWRVSTTTLSPVSGLGCWGLWPFQFWLHWSLGAVAVDAYFGNIRLPRWCSSLKACVVASSIGMLSNTLTFIFFNKTSLASRIDLNAWSGHTQVISNVGELGFAVAFFCLLNWFIRADKNHFVIRNGLSQFFAVIGKISYSIYLVHLPVIFALQKYLPFGNSPTDWILRMLIYVSFALTAGAFFYVAVERWFLVGRCPNFWRLEKPGVSVVR